MDVALHSFFAATILALVQVALSVFALGGESALGIAAVG
jgi:hypothetical protein